MSDLIHVKYDHSKLELIYDDIDFGEFDFCGTGDISFAGVLDIE